MKDAFSIKRRRLSPWYDSYFNKNTIKYCRIPYGRLLPWQDKWIYQSGYEHVFWSLDSKDYLLEDRKKVILRLQRHIKTDDIVLLHDGEGSHPHIIQIVEECLQSLNSNP